MMTRLLSILFFALSANAQALTVGAYNIRNFDYDVRYKISTNKPALSQIIQNLNADVLSVEEINNTKEFETFIPANLPGYATSLTQCGGAHGQHLGFIYNTKSVELLSFNEDLAMSNPGEAGSCDIGSRPLAIALFRVKATGQKFYGMTAHLKSGSNPESMSKRFKQYELLKNIVAELKQKTGVKDFFIAGDLNTTEWANNGRDFKTLTKITKEMGMIDLAQSVKCTAYWWGGTDDGIETPSLLDHVIVTPGLIKSKDAKAKSHGHCEQVACRQVPVGQLGVSYEGVSDHCPITATIQ